MAEKETVCSSKIKTSGIFSFKDYYNFCYKWLTEELGWDVTETKYSEKISGESKSIDVSWDCSKEVTDYFKFEIGVTFTVNGLKKVEVVHEGTKVETNSGSVETKVKGTLVRDYKGKFEMDAFRKFLREIYEKWVIPSRVEQLKEKMASDCEEFLSQSKAFLDLEGKKN